MKRIPHKLAMLATIMALFALSVNSLYAAAGAKKILAFGDSLTSGYGIPYRQSFAGQLEKRLKEEGYDVAVTNAGVSGDTTSGGLARLEWTLMQKPDYVILELGANDMLRAVDPALTRANLKKMLDILRQHKIPVLLAGMKATPNLGEKFVTAYDTMYAELAQEYGAVYYPFFMEGVALQRDLLLEDAMHPNEKGIAAIVEGILPSVKELLKKNN
jgi:acyl-CoA thioesterase-1